MRKNNIITIVVLSLLVVTWQEAGAQILRGGLIESTITVQSPEVAAMTAYVDRPVSYFNGTVPVTIPLCEVTADGYTLPITLTYSTSGFRPSQEATWVGLGWSLSLNACISRSIKCVDDFLEYNRVRKGFFGINKGYYGSAGTSTSDMTTYNLVFKCPLHELPCGDDIYATDLVVDSEPDIFSVSLWNCTDKFVLNDDSTSTVKAIFMERPSGNILRIKTRQENNRKVHFFELVTNDGTVYEFAKRELTCTLSYQGQRCVLDQHPTNIFYEDNADLNASAWLLTKITMPSGRSISFLYDDEVYEAPSTETCMRFRAVYGPSPSNQNPELILPTLYGEVPFYSMNAIYSSYKTEIKTARLREITWDSGAARIIFKTSGRDDMYNTSNLWQAPSKLDSIKVFDASDSLVHSYHLSYGYFNGQPGNSNETHLYKRLRLDKVKDLLTPGWEYSFEYNESIAFPSKMTRSVDYWGYYNGRDYGAEYYCQAYDPETRKLYSGAVKTSDSVSTYIGALTAVVHPTGGRETFEYELNRFHWIDYVQDGGRHLQTLNMTSFNLPGYSTNEAQETFTQNTSMRITLDGTMIYQSGSTTGWSGTLVSITNISTGVTVWSYSDAVVGSGVPNSTVPMETQQCTLPAGSYRIKVHLPPTGWMSSWQVDISESTPVTYRPDTIVTGGAGLRIKRITGGGKKREFNYSIGELLVDPIFSQKKSFTGTMIELDPQYGTITNYYPYTQTCLIQYSESTIPQFTLAKGFLLGYDQVCEHVTGSGHDISARYSFSRTKEQRISPNPYQATMPVFSNGLLESRIQKDNNSIVSTENYTYQTGSSANIRAYDFTYVTGLTPIPVYRFEWNVPSFISSTVDGLTTLTSYSYNNNWQLSQKSTSHRNGPASVGSVVDESYLYTNESTNPVCIEMADSNIILPVRELVYTDNHLSGGSKVSYKKENGRFLPDTIFDVKLDAVNMDHPDSFKARIIYDLYDDAGNPVQVTRDGITTLYVWGYKGQYPISEITGSMNYNQLSGYVGSSTLTSMRDAAAPTSAQFGLLENLRGTIPTVSPGSLMTIRRFKPLVGVSSLTAPNGMVTLYGYDRGGRLIDIRRSGGGTEQLVERYFYNLTGNGSNQ